MDVIGCGIATIVGIAWILQIAAAWRATSRPTRLTRREEERTLGKPTARETRELRRTIYRKTENRIKREFTH